MTTDMITLIFNGAWEIINRHYAATGTLITKEQAHAMLLAELQSGQGAIAAEFAAKGWELPS